MDNSLSRFSTLPEPVAWDSRLSAATFSAALALKRLAWWGCWFKAIVWNFFYFFAAPATITLGWPLCRSAVFLPLKNQQICSPLPNSYRFNKLIELSYSRQYLKISFFCISSLIFITPSTQIANAEADATAIPSRLVIPSIDLDRTIVPVGLKKIEVANQIYQQWTVDDNSVGWHNLSAPLGEAGNSVLNGHSNIYAQVFRDLDKVQIGDTVLPLLEIKPTSM